MNCLFGKIKKTTKIEEKTEGESRQVVGEGYNSQMIFFTELAAASALMLQPKVLESQL